MTLHKLTAGSGYDYLTRQVAVQDTTEKGRTSLAAYYSDKGESPGVWAGSGLKNLDGIQPGDVVKEAQLKALFAFGHHPLADERVMALSAGAGAAAARAAQDLGTPFKVHEADASSFQVEVAKRIAELNASSEQGDTDPVGMDARARVRTEVAREFFERENGRKPADAREIAATVARHTRSTTTAVAGYDLTFSPVKSVSSLWAVADIETATKIERAHQLAVRDALTFIERHALFTREGEGGVRQVDVTGLVAAAFTHRDSRAGDPDLHTHVAVSNKVQTLAGRWLAIDGRVLFKANVTASETYNTALEAHLGAALGVQFAERPGSDPRKRPVREIVGVPAQLNTSWSSRRANIESRTAELARDFQAAHGRPPTPVESIQLAQRATLETRDAKHEPRSFADQRATWRVQAIEVLGSAARVDRVVALVVNHPRVGSTGLASHDLAQLADRVVNEVTQRRATWQVWHLRAEAQRQIRNFGIAPSRVDQCVSDVVNAAFAKSVRLVSDRDGIEGPAELRRIDGTSVFHVAGSDVFTSQQVLDSEQNIVSSAGRADGRKATVRDVDMAVLESAANGADLNTGQVALVRGMATSGARVQLGIAAAGTGKTTAMSALTRAWEESGGNVVGLAPSAAAAAALGEQTGATVDTLAKLVHHITKGDPHPLIDTIGADTMVLIDEAGMADTISLDTAMTFILDKGASVRLVGDDQQLAAIGAGGVLRDIDNQHGALRLNELMRFADPAEGAATLALRDGRPEALGYYLDNRRIDVGDLGTSTDAVFDGWSADTRMGLNSIMLAPTRELVADLNARARTARLAHAGTLGPKVRLADGNEASAGDVIITRQNDRRLGLSATDWVKNGDRWTVLSIDGGRLSVQHTVSNQRTTLPAGYVEQHTELGYASTVHTAQGVSVDTMHGLVTGQESRQQFYTMMTRGRHSNHAYLVVASDGDPHNLIRPETVHPRTPTDMLESIVCRDGSPRSATTMAREAAEPAARLGAAAARYVDALHQAAETTVGADRVTALEEAAEKLVPGIGDEPAWPTLRSHLLLAEAMGQDSMSRFGRAVAERELDGVDDRAAVLDWRLDPTGHRGFEPGPLPWLPPVPAQLGEHPAWGEYLRRRADRVQGLAADVRRDSTERSAPTWARQGAALPAPDVLADVMVWRAATGVDPEDRRPTGPPQIQRAAAAFQRRLNERINAGKAPALAEWGPLIDSAHPRRDQFTPLLAERLAAISRTGVDAAHLFAQAVSAGQLPDDHGAAALWWRISRRLSPAVAIEPTSDVGAIPADWEGLLVDVLGEQESALVTASPWWPTLVASIDQATQRGWSVPDLLSLATTTDVYDVDLAQALVWRIAIVTDPPPEPDPFEYPPPPEESSPSYDGNNTVASVDHASTPAPAVAAALGDDLATVGLARQLMSPPEPTDRDINRALENAHQWDHSPVTGPRILTINALTAAYFETQLNGSWAKDHLLERLETDISGDLRFRPGYAPDGWTNLVNHLQRHGVTGNEMLAAGVATTASTGSLIDRFRDRAILPIISDGNVLGFVGRRHPDTPDGTKAGPKYLNTSDTIAFHKGAQLFGIADDHVTLGAIPVLVECPLDAIAVTVATGGAFVGVAPLGTSLTTDQAAQLAGLGADPVVATDGDLAGRMAAERDYWLLTPHLLEPRFAHLKAGEDPASILQDSGPTGLVVALQRAGLLSDHLLQERATNISDPAALVRESAQVIAARPSHQWDSSIARVARLIDAQPEALQAAVVQAATDFNCDRLGFSNNALLSTPEVRTRIEHSVNGSPAERWANLARTLDPRLPSQPDWPATAAMLQQIHDAGHDIRALTRRLVDTEPLGDTPAQDLRYLMVGYLPEGDQPATISTERPQLRSTEQERKMQSSAARRPEAGPRR